MSSLQAFRVTISKKNGCKLLLRLPKPNKDHSKIKAYRIITMQNITGKLLEKIIVRKLVYSRQFSDSIGVTKRHGSMKQSSPMIFLKDSTFVMRRAQLQ